MAGILLWQEYREAHPDGYGYTWFCCRYADYESRAKPTYRSRHVGGVAMECDYAGHTVPIIDPSSGEIRAAQIYVAVLSASQLTFAYASFSQKLPDWIEANQRAFSFFGGVTKTTVCDNLKAAVAKALWFEPTLNATFAAFAEHYDTTVVPARPRKPRDKASAEGTVLIVERWVLARLRNERFFSLADLNVRISALIEDLNNRTMRRYGKSRRALFDEVERAQLKPLPATPFEYAEWKTAKVHPDYHVEVDRTFYSVPHGLIGKRVAFHEAGHAVVHHALDLGPVRGLNIDSGEGGYNLVGFHVWATDTRDWYENMLTMLMAGRAAEQLVLKRVSSGSGGTDDSDLARATRLAFDMERTLGLGSEHPLLYRPHRDPGAVLDREPELATRVHARLEATLERAVAILRRRRPTFHSLAKALFDAQAMDEEAVLQILTDGDLSP